MKIRDDHVSFPIHPPKEPGYYTIYIFRSKQAMHNHFRRTNAQIGGFRFKANFEAITQSWEVVSWRLRGKNRSPMLGQILFFSGGFGAGIVSHEMTHAALHYSERLGRKAALLYQNREQERLCWLQGFLVAAFWLKFWQAKAKVSWLKG